MKKFKVGDRVKYAHIDTVKTYSESCLKTGAIGSVIAIHNVSSMVKVKWDNINACWGYMLG